MNQFLSVGYRVWQKDFKWYVRFPDGSDIDYHDGMVLGVE